MCSTETSVIGYKAQHCKIMLQIETFDTVYLDLYRMLQYTPFIIGVLGIVSFNYAVLLKVEIKQK